MEPVGDRPVASTASSGQAMEDRTLVSFVLGSLMVAEERITTKFSGPGGRRRQRGGSHLPGHPAGRRGQAHAVLRALPGRGRLRARADRRARRARPRADLARVPDDLRREARRRPRTARREPRRRRREGRVRDDLPPGPRVHARADDVRVLDPLHGPRGPAAGLRRRLHQDPPRRAPPHRLRHLVPAPSRRRRPRRWETSSAPPCASCCPRSPSP